MKAEVSCGCGAHLSVDADTETSESISERLAASALVTAFVEAHKHHKADADRDAQPARIGGSEA